MAEEIKRPPRGAVYPGDPFGRRACTRCELPTERCAAGGEPMHSWCELGWAAVGQRGKRPVTRSGPQPRKTDTQVRGRSGGARDAGATASAPSTIPAPEESKRTIATRGQQRRHRAREVEWMPVPRKAADVLHGAAESTERVYLIGPRPGITAGGLRAWSTGELRDWRPAPEGHFMEGEGVTLRYVRDDGRRLDVYRAAAFYGVEDHDYSPEVAAAAWELAGETLRRYFDPRAVMLATPATTGRDLILRSVPWGREWPVMSDELQQLVRATAGQGRIELLDPAAAELETVHVLDGRLMYAALTWGLPHGVPTLRACDEYLGTGTRARYRVRFTVPADWRTACKCGAPGHARIGLLGVHDGGDGWRWPSDPGERGDTWADGAEVAIALAHGWQLDFDQCIAWPESNVGPLDGWRRRLLKARDVLTALDGRPAELAARAIRSVILHAIGALHGATHRVTRTAPIAEPGSVPADATDLRIEGDVFMWGEGHSTAWAELSHPEWSAAVWSRARARLLHAPKLTGALHVPAHHVIGFRTDAIYLTRDPCWDDDGTAGRFRLKSRAAGPFPWPRTTSDLLKLRGNS